MGVKRHGGEPVVFEEWLLPTLGGVTEMSELEGLESLFPGSRKTDNI